MPRFLAGENFNGAIGRGLRSRDPSLDIATVRDVGLAGEEDSLVLEWAATESRIVLSHDVNTMTDAAYARVRAGLPMPGLIVMRDKIGAGIAIEQILLIAQAGFEGEWEGQVIHVPL